MTTTTDVAVFVSINQDIEDSERGRWMTLSNYANKADFMDAAKKLIGSEVLFFSDVEADFEVGDLITSTDIDSKVWGYISLEDTDAISLVQAYERAFGLSGDDTKQTLAAANKALYGRFERIGDVARDYRYDLSYKKSESGRGIFSAQDLKTLTAHEMGVVLMEHMTEANEYYFWNNAG